MDLVKLRATLRSHITCPSDHFTHATIPTICMRLGLPVPDEEGSKAERMKRALDALPDACLRRTAELYLEGCNRPRYKGVIHLTHGPCG